MKSNSNGLAERPDHDRQQVEMPGMPSPETFWRSGLRRQPRKDLRGLREDTSGAVFVEAALIMPLIAILLAAIAEWGLTMYEYHRLSLATGSAVRQLVINRGFPKPYTNVIDQFTTWAGTLAVQSSQITVSIQKSDGTYGVCNTDTACANLLDSAQGRSAKIEVVYPCEFAFTPDMVNPCPIRVGMIGLVD